MERLLPRFKAAHTQVLGVSVDSVFSHANWAQSLGGISFPLLADFHPKGKMAESYGLYLADNGITDRATLIIDSKGIVRYAVSVTPGGKRNIEELAAECETVDKEHGGGLAAFPEPPGLPDKMTLYIKNNCGSSRAAALARVNLHLEKQIPLKNINDDAGARDELKNLAGKDQAPCLLVDGKPVHESADIIKKLVAGATDIPG